MPQRFLRPGIVTSKRFNSCSWLGQTFYIRLLTLVDDFGRYEADASILRSHAFPLHEDLRTSQVTALCQELSDHHLAIFYRTPDGKDFLELTKWIEKPRAEKSRFPDFGPSCIQMFAADNKCLPPSPSPSPSPSTLDHRRAREGISGKTCEIPGLEKPQGLELSIPQIPPALKASEQFLEWWGKWLQHLKSKRKSPSVHAQDLQLFKLNGMGIERAVLALKHSIEHNWQGIYEPSGNDGGGRGKPNARNAGLMGSTDGNKATRVLAARAARAAQEAAEKQMASQVAGHGGQPSGHPVSS